MKKLFSFLAAALCAVAFAISASAEVDLTKCRAVWDYETDNINYYDIQTGKLVAIEYPSGWIEEVDDETIETEDPWTFYEWDDPTEEAIYSEPEIYLNSYEDSVSINVFLGMEWEADGIVIERQTLGTTGWTQISDMSCDDDWFECEDTNVTGGATYTYRMRAYKLIGGIRSYICEKENSVFVEYGEDMPYLYSKKIGHVFAELTAYIDSEWEAGSAVLSRYDSLSSTWVKVGTSSDFEEPEYYWEEDGLCVTIEDNSLSPETDYLFRFEFFSSIDGTGTPLCSFETNIHTDSQPADPEMLEPEAHSDSLTFTATIDERWGADGFLVEQYSSRKKKWVSVELEDESLGYYDWDENDHKIYSARYTAWNLKSSTKYKYRISFYKLNGENKEVLKTVTASAYTLLKAPKLDLGATTKKAKLSWNKVKGAEGYEIYVFTTKPGDNSDYFDYSYYYYYGYGEETQTDALANYNTSYQSYTIYPISTDQFKKKTTIKNNKTSYSYNIKKNTIYVYRVRAYKTVGGNKVYSDYSNQVTTDSTSALLNGVKLKSKVTVNDYDLGLIKAALKKCVNSKMSNAQKAAAVYDYVNNIAEYEYDYSKIPTDSIEAILVAHRGQCYQYAVTYQAMMQYLGFDVKLVSGKTASGGPHWWCQLNCNGTDYMLDPQVGGRFLIRYDQMGYFQVTKEKVYD